MTDKGVGDVTTDPRRDLAKKFDQARTSSISDVGIYLGVWAGRGDWVSMSDVSRDDAGRRALTELDTLIRRLTEFRRELATEVTGTPAAVDQSEREAERG